MKKLLSISLIMFFALGVHAQIKATDTVKKSYKNVRLKKIKTNGKLIKKKPEEKEKTKKIYSLNGRKLNVVRPINSNISFLKNYEVKDKFTSISDTYGERKISIISDDEKNGIDTKVVDKGKKEENNGLECVNQTITVDANSSSFKEFVNEGNSDWINPGVILNVEDFLDFNRKPFIAARNPITISTNLTRSGSSKLVIQNPQSVSNIQDALNTLKKGGNVASNFSFDYSEIHNIDELSIGVYGEYRNNLIGLETSAGYATRNRKEKHYYKVEVFQNMFSISVDALVAEDIFVDKQPNLQDLLYVSKVNYGRRVIIILESDVKFTSKESELRVEIDRLFQGGVAEFDYNRLRIKRNLDIKAIFYGGDPDNDFRLVGNLIESGNLDANKSLKSYFTQLESNAEQALPISYELRNLNNDRLGMRSVFTQDIRSCTPKLTANLELKVTLTGIQNINTRSSQTKSDSYGLQQYIDYKQSRGDIKEGTMNKQSIKSKNEFRLFPNRIGVANEDGKVHVNQIINGNGDHKIAVQENKIQNPFNINNSLTFTIKPNLFDETVNTRFRIHSWLKEYTKLKRGTKKNVDPTVLVDWNYIDVDLKVVVQYLLDPNAGMVFNERFHDTNLQNDSQFMITGTANVDMPFAKGNDGKSLIGAIRLNKPGTNATAIAWYEFRLVD
ncbi:thiol-activated cytolysin family protein [Polaribacter sp.]|uniref:thiol-activated cytolysin family protein n=1 Tax=Polaribacter sp. TaxID=1920175 RepID=UPI003EF65114